ncbi:hypothetical protein GP486_000113 [Trichoglossum hirsutum]|uniref:Uncharacterized protein n=1 Tax=Trichoglossum hirsutum TaxID=265104 RepID=A0A9P8LJE7_9PEZI|nr:hypothetical protein GP486_000113 [Trichoglossum hirsutum]
MGKRKRKSKQKKPSHSPSTSSPLKSIAILGKPKPKKRGTTQTSAPSPQPQPGQEDSPSATCPPQVNPKLWNRFYEPLVLLSAYGKSQGERVKSDEILSEECIDGGVKTPRKKFLDELAYVCDFSAGGATVTAVAIQDGPQLVYWVAANDIKGARVKSFLSDILQLLGQAYDAGEEKIFELKRQVSDRAIAFSAPRLLRYRHGLRKTIKACLPALETQNNEEENNLKDWLISLKDSSLDYPSFCQLCYEARGSELLEVVRQKAKEGSIQQSDTSYAAQYARVRHFIGRLGSHIKAAQVLVEVGRHSPKLFTDYSIEIATSSTDFTPPAYRAKSSINGIINRMTSDPQACQYYQKELHSQDEKFHLTLEKRIRDEYKDPDFKLRVHAELILLDLFHRRSLRFLDGMRYIGISKPACFLCHRYFQAHPLQVQTSGCSNNLYLQWQPPYIQEHSPARVKEQEDIMNAMLKGIRRFVLDRIVPEYRGLNPHPDSTTGLDTSLYAGDVGARSHRGKLGCPALAAPPRPNTVQADPPRATPALPQSEEDSHGFDEFSSMSEGVLEDLVYEPPGWSDIGAAEGPCEDLGDDSDGGGVSLF